MHACMCVCDVCTYVRIHVCKHLCMYVCMYSCMYMYLYICIYAYMYMYICVICICIVICMVRMHVVMSGKVLVRACTCKSVHQARSNNHSGLLWLRASFRADPNESNPSIQVCYRRRPLSTNADSKTKAYQK